MWMDRSGHFANRRHYFDNFLAAISLEKRTASLGTLLQVRQRY
jgi:hypothetical protein